jgi:hypothetical protein
MRFCLASARLIVIMVVVSLRLETVVKDREVALHFGWLPPFTKRIPLAEACKWSRAPPYSDPFGSWAAVDVARSCV